jgi:hypothetical protein
MKKNSKEGLRINTDCYNMVILYLCCTVFIGQQAILQQSIRKRTAGIARLNQLIEVVAPTFSGPL